MGHVCIIFFLLGIHAKHAGVLGDHGGSGVLGNAASEINEKTGGHPCLEVMGSLASSPRSAIERHVLLVVEVFANVGQVPGNGGSGQVGSAVPRLDEEALNRPLETSEGAVHDRVDIEGVSGDDDSGTGQSRQSGLGIVLRKDDAAPGTFGDGDGNGFLQGYLDGRPRHDGGTEDASTSGIMDGDAAAEDVVHRDESGHVHIHATFGTSSEATEFAGQISSLEDCGNAGSARKDGHVVTCSGSAIAGSQRCMSVNVNGRTSGNTSQIKVDLSGTRTGLLERNCAQSSKVSSAIDQGLGHESLIIRGLGEQTNTSSKSLLLRNHLLARSITAPGVCHELLGGQGHVHGETTVMFRDAETLGSVDLVPVANQSKRSVSIEGGITGNNILTNKGGIRLGDSSRNGANNQFRTRTIRNPLVVDSFTGNTASETNHHDGHSGRAMTAIGGKSKHASGLRNRVADVASSDT